MSYSPGPCPICHLLGGFHDDKVHSKTHENIPIHLKRFKRQVAVFDLGRNTGRPVVEVNGL